MEHFGERLKTLRVRAGLTQAQFAEAIDVHLQTVSKWERGLSEPDISLLGEIAVIFKCPLEGLFSDGEQENAVTGHFEPIKFGKHLALLRKRKGESQEELASALYLNADTLSRWERGVSCPDIDGLFALSRHFALSLSHLYFAIEEAPTRASSIKKKRRGGVLIALLSCLCVVGILLGVLIPLLAPETYLFKVGDKTYEVEEGQEFSIKYEFLGGNYANLAKNPDTVVFGEEVSLTPLAKDGYEFLGWFTAKEGGEEVKKITAENVFLLDTLFARFSAKQFEITLDGAGGTFSSPAGKVQVHTYLLPYGNTLQLPVCERVGHEFLGWFDEDGQPVSEINEANIQNLNLTASWRALGLTYQIEYVLDGGEMLGTNPTTVAYGEILPLAPAYKAGYDFLGWYGKVSGNSAHFEFTPSTYEGTLSLTAKFQERVTAGSNDDFRYEKGADSVAITFYKGAKGENVHLVIPDEIEGLPVRSVGITNAGSYGGIELASLTLPSGLVEISDYAFDDAIIHSTVTIPATVQKIGYQSFYRTTVDGILFEEGSQMTTIGKSAFEGAYSNNAPIVLPEGIETLEENAFYYSFFSNVILPSTLKTIKTGALVCRVTGAKMGATNSLFLPESVKTVAPYSVVVLERSLPVLVAREKADTVGYADQWYMESGRIDSNLSKYGVKACTLTLKDGESETQLTGNVFSLPTPKKAGYEFLAWQSASGDFYGEMAVLGADATLTAIYREKSEHDGLTPQTPFLLTPDKQETVYLRWGETFYFKIPVTQATAGTVNYTLYRWKTKDEVSYSFLQKGNLLKNYRNGVPSWGGHASGSSITAQENNLYVVKASAEPAICIFTVAFILS